MNRRARDLNYFGNEFGEQQEFGNLLSRTSLGVRNWASARLWSRSTFDTNASPPRLDASGPQKREARPLFMRTNGYERPPRPCFAYWFPRREQIAKNLLWG